MVSFAYTLTDPMGLHMRPAGMMAKRLAETPCSVVIRCGTRSADAKSILIFALSADAFVEDERLSIESGMNGHYAKPVVFRALQRNIGKFLQRRERVS